MSVELPTLQTTPASDRDSLVRRARLLAWLGLGWHGVEAAVAITAGIVAGSIALVGFGADSLIESLAGVILLWRFAATRASSERAEHRAQRLIGTCFYVLAAYIAVEAARTLVGGHHPDVSWVGIGLAAVTLVTMPPLALAKARVGELLGDQKRRAAEHGVRLPLGGTAGGSWGERRRGLVVGRPRDRARHRRRRRPRGT